VIKKNKYRPDKNLFTKNILGEKIGLYEALDETDEADFVATKILEVADGGIRGKHESEKVLEWSGRGVGPRRTEDLAKLCSGSCFPEVAVLYRANFQSRALEEAMLRYNIPYQVLGVKFFERKEIKDTLAYLRAALNPQSLSDIKRIINFPARGIGKVTLLKIFASPRRSLGGGWAGDTASLPAKMRAKIDNFYKILEEIKEKISTEKASNVIKFAVKRSGIERELSSGTDEDMERLENIKELATLALKYDPPPGQPGGRAGNMPNAKENISGIEKLLEDASLASDQDSLMISKDKIQQGESLLKKDLNTVKLMTVHASKGLEFKYVFITGLEDGLFPHERHDDSPASAQGFGPLRHSTSEASEAQEEERRLFYVALTRAKEKLFLSFANFRTIFGSRNINAPSEFIADIPGDLLEREGEEGRIKTIYI
jgi:DNA helicase-2/ATP-dependent DNA helicase PcrA